MYTAAPSAPAGYSDCGTWSMKRIASTWQASPPGGVTTGIPFDCNRQTKYLMASAEAPATSNSVISRIPTAMASISFDDMPP